MFDAIIITQSDKVIIQPNVEDFNKFLPHSIYCCRELELHQVFSVFVDANCANQWTRHRQI